MEQHDLAHAFFHLLPTLSEYRHFCFPSDKGSQPALFDNNIESGACLTCSEDVIGHAALITPWQRRHVLLLPEEIALDQAGGGGTDDHHPWLGQILESCGNRQSFPDRERVVPATTNFADDHWSSMDPKAHGETPLGRNCLLGRGGRPILERLDHA